MDQRLGLFVLLAAGLLCLSLAPVSRADDLIDDQGDDMDVEDEMHLDLAGAEDEEDMEEEGDVQDEAPKAPPTPKVRFILNVERVLS